VSTVKSVGITIAGTVVLRTDRIDSISGGGVFSQQAGDDESSDGRGQRAHVAGAWRLELKT
jgi:hypothetical protein